MKQDSKVLYYIFLTIGIVTMLISAAIFYHQYRATSNALHTTGIIVDTEWRRSNPNARGTKRNKATWRPVVAFRPTPDYTLIFQSKIGSALYENSEGETVDVIYPPGQPHKAKIYSPWMSFFQWGILGLIGIAFTGASLLIRPCAKKKQRIVQ
ncbi:DUF3592 domain-containing protein [Klebsiella spallanzanii]|uniref:DUF3592 domain-containing protein n=1 Tax=Klebsiella spallanzanii TaxID=2587528 RepID=UPI00115A0F50|nr:DUF3592 domain-containing protein [Klebsiella spallanzanii]VUS33163.1 Inner membrane protein YmfA [Klebsiella spallanzanii]